MTRQATRREVLFTLWIFVMFLYAYCDILGLYDSRNLNQLLTGVIDGITMDEGVLIAAAVLMMLKIVMIPVTRFAGFALAKWSNVVVALLATAVMVWSVTTPTTVYYWMFAAVEIPTTALMVWLALTWREDA